MGKIKKLFLILVTVAAAFCVFWYSFGFVSAFADESEISANYEAISTGEEGDSSAVPQNDSVEGGDSSALPQNDSGGGASNDGGLDGIIPETEVSVWFEEKIAPYILEYGAAALGVLSGLLLVLGKLKKSIAGLVGAYNALKTANENNDKTKAEVQTLKADSAAWQERQEQKMEEYFARQEQMMEERFDAIAEQVTDKLEDIDMTAHKILDVEEIAYEDNPIMVSKGTSKKIAEVIHNGKTGEKKNESNG